LRAFLKINLAEYSITYLLNELKWHWGMFGLC